MSRFDPVDIGEAARRAGLTVAALRLYEREGLMPMAARSAAGYRQYSADDLRRARAIRRARRAGLSMRQIAEVFGGAGVHVVLAAHVEALGCEEQRIARLRRHLGRWLRGPHGAC